MCSIMHAAKGMVYVDMADMAHSAGACPIMDVLSAGDQKKLSQRLPSVWGRWEAGWDYYHHRFTGISAPRSSTYLSEKVTRGSINLFSRTA